MINEDKNQLTQPLRQHKIFNNWEVVAEGWYPVMPANRLKRSEVKSLLICGQHLVFFRTESNKLTALDGYCPHMGVDLGIGKVQGENLRCFFHHWEFNQQGDCVKIPCQETIPKKARIKHYPCLEKYGMIWVHPNTENPSPLLEIPKLAQQEVSWQLDRPYFRKCHHHITMVNGIDPQHLKTVHDLNLSMNLSIKEDDSGQIEIDLQGKVPTDNLKDRLMKTILGPEYSYSMNYADGTLAGLTIMKDVKLFGRFDVLPTLHMFFAYRPESRGKTFVQPIYVTKKRRGLVGALTSQALLAMTKLAFKFLQGEDGEVYENIRFNSENLLPIDGPIARYIGYINRLKPSLWSKHDAL